MTQLWLTSRTFWSETADRALKSLAQGFLLAVGQDVMGWMSLDWTVVAYNSVGMAVLSLMMSIAGTGVGDPLSPSFVRSGKPSRDSRS